MLPTFMYEILTFANRTYFASWQRETTRIRSWLWFLYKRCKTI